MSLTWHIVRKDLYRLRWVLLLWVVAIAARLVFASIQSSLDGEGSIPFQRAAWAFGMIFVPVIGFSLVMGVQDDDPVSDADAFWVTRPISGGRLLSAKAIVLAALCAVPALVTAPYWLSHGYSLTQIRRAAELTTEWQVAITLLAVPFAAISPNGTRFVGNVLVGGGVFLLVGLAFRLIGIGQATATSDGVLVSRIWMDCMIGAAASVTAMLMQHFTRQTRYSMAILIAAGVGIFLISGLWSRNIASGPTETNPLPIDEPTLSFESATISRTAPKTPGGEMDFRADFEVAGLREGDVAVPTTVAHRIEWANRPALEVDSPPASDDLATACWFAALGEGRNSTIQSDVRIPPGIDASLLGAATRYSAVIHGDIWRPRVVAMVRPVLGETSSRGGMTLKVGDVMPNDPRGILAIWLSESTPRLSLSAAEMLAGEKPPADFRWYYFLVNPRDGRSLIASASPSGDPLNSATVGYFRTELDFQFLPEQAWKRNVPPDIVSWIKDATLVKVEADDLGSFQKSIDVPHIEFGPRKPAPTP
jgi:hypothetical protein